MKSEISKFGLMIMEFNRSTGNLLHDNGQKKSFADLTLQKQTEMEIPFLSVLFGCDGVLQQQKAMADFKQL